MPLCRRERCGRGTARAPEEFPCCATFENNATEADEKAQVRDLTEVANERPQGHAAFGRATFLKPPALPEVADYFAAKNQRGIPIVEALAIQVEPAFLAPFFQWR